MPNKNAAVEKLSPMKNLTTEQANLLDKIINFAQESLVNHNTPAVFTIYGEAGTGKSVVLSQFFNRLQTAARTEKNSPFFRNAKLLFSKPSRNSESLSANCR